MTNKKTIYIVDDDEDDVFVVTEAISELRLDIDVYYAFSGPQLLEILDRDVKNAIILVDMNMPIMNGLETLQAVYSNPMFEHIRSILISTNSSDELREQALNSGAMKVLCKPSNYDEYIKLMDDVINKCF